MIDLPFLILIVAAALCLGLNRVVATRVLGYGAAGAALVSGLALFMAARRAPLPIERPLFEWLVPGTLVVQMILRLDTWSLAVGLLLLVGGAVALLALALALAQSLRGFGSLFGWSLLLLASGLGALCCATPVLLPYLWVLLALTSFAAVWTSGVLGRGAGVSPGSVFPLLAGPLLLIGTLPSFSEANPSNTVIVGTGSAVCVILAVLLATGLPPFQVGLDNLLAGPAALAGLLSGLGLPLVALANVWRLIVTSGQPLPGVLRYLLLLLGLLGLLICAAGALREHTLKTLLGWQLGGQAGVVLVALGLYRPGLAGADSGLWALLSNMALTTLASMLAVAVLERTGGDDFTTPLDEAARSERSLRLAGIIWGLVGASAVGLPPLWGFWGRYWLINAALAERAWVVPFLLAGSTLAALAYFAPLVAFLRPQQPVTPNEHETSHVARWSNVSWIAACGLVPAAVCLLFGVAPQLAWPLPLVVGRLEQSICIALLLVGLVLIVVARRLPLGRPTLVDPDMTPIVLAPDALGDSLYPFGWLGKPQGLLEACWNTLLKVGDLAQLIMSLFERRYYLAGLLAALIIAILLMAQ